MDVQMLLDVVNVMDGKNSNTIQCYLERNNASIKIVINKIVLFITINKKEGNHFFNNLDMLNKHLKLEYLRLYQEIVLFKMYLKLEDQAYKHHKGIRNLKIIVVINNNGLVIICKIVFNMNLSLILLLNVKIRVNIIKQLLFPF